MLVAVSVAAEPVAATPPGKTVITLYSGPCALPEVRNLRGRAEWKEGDKIYKGCWNINVFKIIELYFEDRTVVGLPSNAFSRISGS